MRQKKWSPKAMICCHGNKLSRSGSRVKREDLEKLVFFNFLKLAFAVVLYHLRFDSQTHAPKVRVYVLVRVVYPITSEPSWIVQYRLKFFRSFGGHWLKWWWITEKLLSHFGHIDRRNWKGSCFVVVLKIYSSVTGQCHTLTIGRSAHSSLR